MSSVLVTGASGFIGLPTLLRLARDGRDVHAVSTQPQTGSIPGVHWHRIDLADSAAVETLIADVRPRRLVHLAWYVEHRRFWQAPENIPWVERSLQLLRAFAQAGGRRAVMLGTCAEYDWSTTERPLSERTSPIDPSTLYGVAKDALRRLAYAYAAQQGFEMAWGRLFFPYGPREAPGRLIASVARSLLSGEPAETSSGTQRRDFLHVEDVARAVVDLLDSSVVGPVNIASGEAVALREVIERVAQAVGRPDLVHLGALPDRPGDPALLVGDVARLHEEVGFRPTIDLAAGISSTVNWFRAELSPAG